MKGKSMNQFISLMRLSLGLVVGLSACTKIKNDPQVNPDSSAQSMSTTTVSQNVAPVIPNGKTFTFRLLGDPETLDWNRAHTSVETHLLINLMEGLVSYDKDLGVIPALAETWTRSSDGKTYTFKLRKGVKWSDGVPLTAKDFVYSWKRLLSPVTSASYAYLLFEVEGAEDFYKGKSADFSTVGVSAPDDSTFVVKLRNPVAYFIHIPTFWVTFPLREDVVHSFELSHGHPKVLDSAPDVLYDGYKVPPII
jgi:oligopeptide transport system substrate-binding protein